MKPLISSLGSTNGLDFINAVEADVLLFVEGEDDARAFDVLLRQQIKPKKYAYWVLGGVSKVLDHILYYQTVLSNVKNKKTLWEKSILVIDRDFLNDAHQSALPSALQTKIGLKTCMADAYTFESTLLTDLPKFARLLVKWLESKEVSINSGGLEQALVQAYVARGAANSSYWSDDAFVENTCYLYRNAREKLNTLLDQKFINANDIQLHTLVRTHIQSCLNSGQYYKLMNKEDVQWIVNEAISITGLVFNTETDFIELMYAVDKSLWFAAWDFLNTI